MSTSPPSLRSRDADGFCQVCGKPAHGIHFTVVSCRACAAFFRRSASDSDRYKCRRSTEDCDVTKSNCRLCRWQRCKKLGMTTEDVVYTKRKRDPLEDDLNELINEEVDDAEDELEESKFSQEGHKFTVDCSREMPMIIEILSQRIKEPKRMKQSPLQAMIEAYKTMVPGGKPERIEISSKVNLTATQGIVREQIKRIAKWAMQCEEFAVLPLEDKRKIYCNFWAYMHSIERCARAEEFLESDCQPEWALMEDGVALDNSDVEYFIPGMDDENVKQIADHLRVISRVALHNFILPMRKLKLSTFEVVYLCFFKLWSISKVSDLSPQSYQTAEKLLESASSELHEFYVRELKMKNYAERVSRLFSVLSGLESSWRAWTANLLSADVAQVYHSNYHETEFFTFAKE